MLADDFYPATLRDFGVQQIGHRHKSDSPAWNGACVYIGSVSYCSLRQGCSTKVGLRDTLEPDPDNTGVGSFRSQAFFFLDS